MTKHIIVKGSPTVYLVKRRKYTWVIFLLDLLMVFLTGGLWIISIIIREMRR